MVDLGELVLQFYGGYMEKTATQTPLTVENSADPVGAQAASLSRHKPSEAGKAEHTEFCIGST